MWSATTAELLLDVVEKHQAHVFSFFLPLNHFFVDQDKSFSSEKCHLIDFGVKLEAELQVEDLCQTVRNMCCHNMFAPK